MPLLLVDTRGLHVGLDVGSSAGIDVCHLLHGLTGAFPLLHESAAGESEDDSDVEDSAQGIGPLTPT